MWPCSYDHRELAYAAFRLQAPGIGPGGTICSSRKTLQRSSLISDNSIFCTRKLIRIHIARRPCISLPAAGYCLPAGSEERKYGQAARLISTSQLKASLLLHIWPIDLVIFQESLGALWLGRSHLVEGFTLRCIQRFSRPHVATERCHWRDNSYTRGASIPVLSY